MHLYPLPSDDLLMPLPPAVAVTSASSACRLPYPPPRVRLPSAVTPASSACRLPYCNSPPLPPAVAVTSASSACRLPYSTPLSAYHLP
jgi:hypothetical protein